MDEHELIKEAQGGNEMAWTNLVRGFMKDAYGLSLRLTGGDGNEAEEISQDAFVQAYRYLKGFREEVPFKKWLYKIITNLFINRQKSRRRLVMPLKEETICIQKPRWSEGAGAVLSEELQGMVKEKMNQLPAQQKAVLVLYTYEALSLKEIAETLKISYEGVKMHLSLARKQMRSALKEYLD